jgi:hypothetical protein
MGSPGLNSPAQPRSAAAVRTGLTSVRPPAWLAFLLIGLALAAASVPSGDLGAQVRLVGLGLSSAAVVVMGVRIHRPVRRWPWLLLALSTVMTTVGSPFISASGSVGVFAQVLTGAGGVTGVVGFAAMIRGRIPGGDRAALLDAAIVASAIGMLVWAFGLAPNVILNRDVSVIATIAIYPSFIALA